MWPRGATSCKTNTARADLGVGAALNIAEHFLPQRRAARRHALSGAGRLASNPFLAPMIDR